MPDGPGDAGTHETNNVVGTRVPLKAFAGGRVFGERTGTGPPAVLALHGWGRDRSDFGPLLTGLDAVAVDLPGFGASPPPSEPWGAAEYAESIVPVLDEFPGPSVVLGHSFGGRVAVCLAAAHPERVVALVLTGVPLLPRAEGSRRPSLRYRAARALYRARLLSPTRMERIRHRHGSRDYRAATGVMRDVLVRAVNESYERELRALRCPVELVWGETDTAAPLEMARRAAALVPTAELTIVLGAGHFSPVADPGPLRVAIEKHLP
jgi:pimeloyl-ACP methyl ester carboxylesterase